MQGLLLAHVCSQHGAHAVASPPFAPGQCMPCPLPSNARLAHNRLRTFALSAGEQLLLVGQRSHHTRLLQFVDNLFNGCRNGEGGQQLSGGQCLAL